MIIARDNFTQTQMVAKEQRINQLLKLHQASYEQYQPEVIEELIDSELNQGEFSWNISSCENKKALILLK